MTVTPAAAGSAATNPKQAGPHGTRVGQSGRLGDRRPRRWHRAAIPLAIAVAVLIVSAIAHAVEQPDTGDPAFLSPRSDAAIGARSLADRVGERRVSIQRETNTGDALRATRGGDTTLFVPAPEFVHRDYARLLPSLPNGTRVVLVDAQTQTLYAGQVPMRAGQRRWTTAVTAPTDGGAASSRTGSGGPSGSGCGLGEARAAGPAAMTRQRYDAGTTADEQPSHRCYDDGLVVLRWGNIELVLAGASDPFRNDRLGEHGNAALATGLLTTRPRLIWLDLHQADPPPVSDPAPPEEPTEPDEIREDLGDEGDLGGDGPGEAPGEPAEGPDREPGEASGSDSNGDPLLGALPPWFWAMFAQLALAAVVLVLWRARRLGPPVAEPLPVTVRSAETVHGRGRLYQRAHARGPAMDMLRAATRLRVTALLGLPPDAHHDAVAAAVSAQCGRPVAEVETLLYGPTPTDDKDLVRMAGELDALRSAVTAPAAERRLAGQQPNGPNRPDERLPGPNWTDERPRGHDGRNEQRAVHGRPDQEPPAPGPDERPPQRAPRDNTPGEKEDQR